MWKPTSGVRAAGAMFALVATTSCAGATAAGPAAPRPGDQRLPLVTRPITPADVQFMAGMIPHHAQAVKMAGWAQTHGSREEIRLLAERMIVSQRDEIALLQQWLRDHDQPVPPADATHHRMSHGGVEHDMLMPGMLNDEELARLERARGDEFDRLFLEFMIRHHEGAIIMVDQLFGSIGGAQDDFVFKFASDVSADQTAEIDRMQRILASVPAQSRTP